MSQFTPFSAQAKCIRLSLTTVASAAVALPCAANVLRVVNHGNDCYLAIADTAALAVATVPTTGAGTTTSTPALGRADTALGIPNDTIKYISGILDAGAPGTTYVDVIVGEGM